MSERLEMARWLADRRGVSFDDCDDEEQAEWQWEAEAVIGRLTEYTDTDEELAMANARIKDLEAGLEHEGCDRVLHATETALAAAQHQVEVEQMSVERWRGWHQEKGRIAAEAIKRAERAEEEAVNAHRAWLRVSDELDDLRDSIADPFTQGAVVRAEVAEAELERYREALEEITEAAEGIVPRQPGDPSAYMWLTADTGMAHGINRLIDATTNTRQALQEQSAKGETNVDH